ncbi:MAG TPA: RNA 3'-terminal phosphate cyclase [Sedimentisphaerales bacterium]|nr:RNA 3'-terminal phosphate cyclase [Sedimentisphaerales bacterium]
METVFVDGSMGEGGGQILRTSLALACITGRNLHIENIRAARRKPGLAKQHLSCVRAAREICGGQCKGAAIGSQVLDFQPGPIRGGNFSFDIGSAGSASLVIQTILPALFLADKPSTVTVTGGTHNPWAPPFDFLAETFLPAIATAGFDADCKLEKYGFFPAGGGKIALNVRPRHRIPNQSIDFCEPAENIQIHARIYTAKLPAHIAQRQKKLLNQSKLKFRNIEHIEVTDSDGPGNCIMIRLVASSSTAWGWLGRTTVFTAFGQRGKPSEKVVGEVTSLAHNFLASATSVDRFLADQLLIYMAISKSGCYTTNDLSTHLTTNIETIKKFLPVDFTIEQQNQIHQISCKSGSS